MILNIDKYSKCYKPSIKTINKAFKYKKDISLNNDVNKVIENLFKYYNINYYKEDIYYYYFYKKKVKKFYEKYCIIDYFLPDKKMYVLIVPFAKMSKRRKSNYSSAQSVIYEAEYTAIKRINIDKFLKDPQGYLSNLYII
jgi:hypothetical protein